ncbi:MAG: DUF692 family protein [Thermoflexales bacterium]|nr:DUF692 family protein [Thermoflexales bacterium]
MKLAVNYSLQAAVLLRDGAIALDAFKCPDWPDVIAEAGAQHPLYVHFGFRAGSGALETVDWKHVEDVLAQTGTPYVNLHLYPRVADFGVDDPADVDDETVARRMICDVKLVVERFGPERVIVENIPYPDPDSAVLRTAVEVKTIRRVVCESGCGFLLDIGHARIAARSLQMDERAYISQLPVERLRELHVTGLEHDGQYLRDHRPMTDTDWPTLEWVLGNIRADNGWAKPWAVVFEYGGIGDKLKNHSQAKVLAAQVPRLYELVHRGLSE